MKIKIEYVIDAPAIPDNMVEEWARKILDTYINAGDSDYFKHVKVSTEAMVDIWRVLVAEGDIAIEDITFEFDGIDLGCDKRGSFSKWPYEMETTERLLSRLIEVDMKAAKKEKEKKES